MIVAQWVEWSRLTPEIHGSNPVIGKLYLLWSVLRTVVKNEYKEAGNDPIKKIELPM